MTVITTEALEFHNALGPFRNVFMIYFSDNIGSSLKVVNQDGLTLSKMASLHQLFHTHGSLFIKYNSASFTLNSSVGSPIDISIVSGVRLVQYILYWQDSVCITIRIYPYSPQIGKVLVIPRLFIVANPVLQVLLTLIFNLDDVAF
jgi:hypothetical protein